MISARYLPQVQSLLLAAVMTLVVSLVTTFANVGLVDNFLTLWLPAWGMAFVIAFPTLLLVKPVVWRIAVRIAGG